MNIVFMGTPDFAVPCLEKLVAEGHNIKGVFTREDKPVGRKQILTPPPVKVAAQKYNIPVFQPKMLRGNPEAFEILKEINPDVIVVVAYGRLLPKEILNLPKYGSVNVHASLLPKLRGASPIQWSIVSGAEKTGVTTMLMDEGLDTGDMLEVAEVSILKEDTAETLHDKLSEVGSKLICSTLLGLENGTVKPIPQPSEGVTHAPILTKEMGRLDFNKTAAELDCLIRGFTPWPLCYFYFEGRRFKVLKALPVKGENTEPGILFEKGGEVFISCGKNSALQIINICPDGSKKMDYKAFLNGRFIESGSKLD